MISMLISALASFFLVVTPAHAADPVVKCHSGKLKEVGKYASCLMKAYATGVAKNVTPDVSKCEEKFTGKYTGLETKAGPGVCPTEGDEADINALVSDDANTLAVLLAGGSAPPPCLRELKVSDPIEMYELTLDETGRVEAVPECGDAPEICCADGTPTTPCGPLHIDIAEVSVVDVEGQDRFDFSVAMHVASVADIPVSQFGLECLMTIDTSPGAFSTVKASVPLEVSSDGQRVQAIGDATIERAESVDFTMSGATLCQFNDFTSAYQEVLLGAVGAQVQQFLGFCGFCDSSVGQCPS